MLEQSSSELENLRTADPVASTDLYRTYSAICSQKQCGALLSELVVNWPREAIYTGKRSTDDCERAAKFCGCDALCAVAGSTSGCLCAWYRPFAAHATCWLWRTQRYGWP
jgi:hypothetical protein